MDETESSIAFTQILWFKVASERGGKMKPLTSLNQMAQMHPPSPEWRRRAMTSWEEENAVFCSFGRVPRFPFNQKGLPNPNLIQAN